MRVDTVVIGAGQAGFATSFLLKRGKLDHVVLERDRVASSWLTRRWDSFTLIGPNWTCSLPGQPYGGADPDGYMGRDELVRFFQTYARSFDLPVQEHVDVRRVRRTNGAFEVETGGEAFIARQVVVATGAYQRPKIPAASRDLDPGIHQVHTDGYRNPSQLPAGAVLVVGSGQSGSQIAEELREAGRTVYLSTSTTGWYPRRYRGRDNMRWRFDMGFFDRRADAAGVAGQRLPAVPMQTGKDGGRDINLRTLAARGVILAGRFAGARGSQVSFAPDLDANLARSDQVARELLAGIDGFIAERGIDAPAERADLFFSPLIQRIDSLDLAQAGVSAIVWGTGYALDFRWIELPAFDEHGYPIQSQGVTPVPGLYFVGLHWMHTRKSGLILGVGEDAQHVVAHMTAPAPR